MCGIVGVRGLPDAARQVKEGLHRLEYRGYDSAGVAWSDDHGIELRRAVGRVKELGELPSTGPIAIGHTRWATHGGVTEQNAHPHLDGTRRYAVVHNGTIEGHHALRAGLAQEGHAFYGETDTELLAHLYERHRRTLSPLDALRSTFRGLHGSWACLFLDAETDTIGFIRNKTPLCIGLTDDGVLFASDVAAIVPHTRDVVYLDDGDHGIAGPNGLELFDADGVRKKPTTVRVDWDAAQAEKSGYPHFTLKEIHDGPSALNGCLSGRLQRNPLAVHLDLPDDFFTGIRRLRLVACGTSYHAALMGQHFIEHWSGLPTDVVVASELHERPVLDDDALTIAVSQSGETLDTLEAVKALQRGGGRLLAVTNVRGSTLDRIADATLLTHVGPEVGVAATKTLLGQSTLLALLALRLSLERGHLPGPEQRRIAEAISRLPRTVEAVLRNEGEMERIGHALARSPHLFFLGRGIHLATALEAALKFKEITYLHAEGFGAAELKHGPFALLDHKTPCVFFLRSGHLGAKTLGNIMEVSARNAPVYAFTMSDEAELEGIAEATVTIPCEDPLLAAIPFSVAGQLVAYHAAALLERDIDKPRNLAKSVTVE